MFWTHSRRFQSLTGQETIFTTANGPSGGAAPAGAGVTPEQLEAVKQEILTEMRKEVQKAKQDIIEGQQRASSCDAQLFNGIQYAQACVKTNHVVFLCSNQDGVHAKVMAATATSMLEHTVT